MQAYNAGNKNLISISHALHLSKGNANKLSGEKFIDFLKSLEVNSFPAIFLESTDARLTRYEVYSNGGYLKKLKVDKEKYLINRKFCLGYINIKK